MLRKICAFLAVICLAVLSAHGADIFKDVKVEMKFTSTPTYTVSGTPNSTRGNSKWLVLDISYKVPNIKEAWGDNIDVEVAALLPVSRKGERGIVYLTGKTTLAAVRLDGKIHRTRMLIPPHVFERYSASETTALSDISVQVKIYSPDDELLGETIESKNNMRNAEQAFQEAETKGQKGLIMMKNYILSRERTPWFYVMHDYFDPIAPEASK